MVVIVDDFIVYIVIVINIFTSNIHRTRMANRLDLYLKYGLVIVPIVVIILVNKLYIISILSFFMMMMMLQFVIAIAVFCCYSSSVGVVIAIIYTV